MHRIRSLALSLRNLGVFQFSLFFYGDDEQSRESEQGLAVNAQRIGKLQSFKIGGLKRLLLVRIQHVKKGFEPR